MFVVAFVSRCHPERLGFFVRQRNKTWRVPHPLRRLQRVGLRLCFRFQCSAAVFSAARILPAWPLSVVVIPRGCDFFNFARNSILKRIDLHDENRAFRNKVTLSERSQRPVGSPAQSRDLHFVNSHLLFILTCGGLEPKKSQPLGMTREESS